MKLDKLRADFEHFELSIPEMFSASFVDYKAMPKKHGLYSIWQEDRCIYIGQAGGRSGIHARMFSHYHKAHALFLSKTGKSNGVTDVAGWCHGRKQSWWKPDTWVVEYLLCDDAAVKSAFEGIMMMRFNPYCNDETFPTHLKREQDVNA